MQKTILYPFEIHSKRNRNTYIQALLLARRLGARLIIFTTIPEWSNEEEEDSVLLHLLELHGHYQAAVNGWRSPIQVCMQRVIARGELLNALLEWIRWQPVDYLVCQPHSRILNGEVLRRNFPAQHMPRIIGG